MVKKIISLVLVIAAVFSFSACDYVYTGDYQGPWWTEEGNGAARLGYSVTKDFTMPTTTAWIYKISGGHSESTPLVFEGLVYFGATDGVVYCLRDSDGKVQWTYATEDSITNSPIYKAGKLYVTSNDGYLYILDAKTGKLDDFVSLGGAVKKTPVIVGNTIILTTAVDDEGYEDYWVKCLSLDTKKFVWTYSFSENVMTNITYYNGGVDGGIVVFGCDDMNYYAMNATTGKILWTFNTPNSDYRNAVAYEDKIYFGDGVGMFYCRDIVTGELIWSHKANGGDEKLVDDGKDESEVSDESDVGMWLCSAPAIANGKVVYGGYDYYMYCRDAETGELIWKRRAPYWVMGAVTIVGNSVLVGGRGVLNATDDEANITYLFCFDLDDGDTRWQSRSRGDVRKAPSVVDGCIYYVDEYGQVIKLK